MGKRECYVRFGSWRKVFALNSLDFKSTVKDFEISLLSRALEQNQCNQNKVVGILSHSYHQLRGYLRKYDLLG